MVSTDKQTYHNNFNIKGWYRTGKYGQGVTKKNHNIKLYMFGTKQYMKHNTKWDRGDNYGVAVDVMFNHIMFNINYGVWMMMGG